MEAAYAIGNIASNLSEIIALTNATQISDSHAAL